MKKALFLLVAMIANVSAWSQTQTVVNVVEQKATVTQFSTLYVGEVVLDGQPSFYYLYSENLKNSETVFAAVRDCLSDFRDGNFSALIPNIVGETENLGIAVCSNSSYESMMTSDWTSAADASQACISNSAVVSSSSVDLYETDADFAAKCSEGIDEEGVDYYDNVGNDWTFSGVLGKLTTSITDDVTYTVIDGHLVKHIDRHIDYTCESVTVIYTKVELETLDPGPLPQYTYNSTTGELTLNWGEFNSGDKWGDDVPIDDVTSVTATDEVSFVGDCSELFAGFSNCTIMDLSSVNTDEATDMSEMFSDCSNLTNLYLTGWNTINVTNMESMFDDCNNLTAIDGISYFTTVNVTDMSGMFEGCNSLISLDLSGFSTGNVGDMSYMFHSCDKLSTLDISGWDTQNVTDMSCMFYDCKSLDKIDVSDFNTVIVTDMSSMFYGCFALGTLNVSSFETGNVTDMHDMFAGCSHLTTLDLSNFSTNCVTNMSGMLNGCLELTSLDLSNLITSSVENMSVMFTDCRGLTTLDISGWDTGNVTDMSNMFFNCDNLRTIYVGEGWSTTQVDVSGSMFAFCASLVGGMGTIYDMNHTDAEYAHIDGTDNPGYLTGLFVISLPENIEHGTLVVSQGDNVFVNGDRAITDQTVTLTVTPDNGYELDALTVTYTNDGGSSGAPKRLRGGSIELTPGDDGTYTFDMPAAPVTVNATFKETVSTGVVDIEVAKARSCQRYNLMGQPVGKDYKGIVIEDGKKRVIK